MSPVWVNGKFLDETPSKKIEKWKPAAEQEKRVWEACPDCGLAIYEMDSYWCMGDNFACVWGGCWEKYYTQGQGFHAPAGLDFGVALEG
jgi:hypothetical protein